MSALLLSAVGGTGWETGLEWVSILWRYRGVFCIACSNIGFEEIVTYVALAADHLVAVELGGESLEGWLDDTTTETEDQVEGRLL